MRYVIYESVCAEMSMESKNVCTFLFYPSYIIHTLKLEHSDNDLNISIINLYILRAHQ